MIATKTTITQCAIVVLICVYVMMSSKSRFREQKRVPSYKRRYSRKSRLQLGSREIDHEVRKFTPARNCTIGPHTLNQTKRKSYAYDIAIVSMSKHWYERVSALPREIRCNNSPPSSILIRKASEDEGGIRRADILIFAGKVFSYHEWTELQRLRHSGQLWVHTTEESPFTSLSICPPMDMNIHFNLSFTYHPEADISVPYGQFNPFQQKYLRDFKSNFYKKTKLIVWVSSHCLTPMWRRTDFAYDLAKYLPLDTYGACGTLDCPKHQSKCTKLFKRYKFYLAMENSCCGGYITEKFWNALTHLEAIPVVVGAPKRDYEKLAPNNSFIHVDDFGSIKELADYILKVSKSKKLYDSFFQWKRLGKARNNPIGSLLAFTEKGVCRLTEYLESPGIDSSLAPSFDPYGPNWFGGCNECGEQGWLKKYSNFKYDLPFRHQSRNV